MALDSSSRDASDEQAGQARSLALASDLSLGLGVAAGCIGGLWLLLAQDEGEPDPSSLAATFAPVLGDGTVGLHAEGRF